MLRAVVQAAAKTLPRPHAHLGEGSGAASRRRSSVHISATAGTPAHDGGSWQCRPDQIAIVPTARAKRAAVLELGNSAEPSTCVVADGLGLGKRLIVLATLGKRVSEHDICVN